MTTELIHKFAVKDDKRHTVLGAVVIPDQVDTQGEALTTEAIERMLEGWFRAGRATKVDTAHNYQENGCVIIQAGIARKNDPLFAEGTLYAKAEISPELWPRIANGEFHGFSWAGPYDKAIRIARIASPRLAQGTTEKSDHGPYPEHFHNATLRFDAAANVIPGFTEPAMGHRHPTDGTTRTGFSNGHTHDLLVGHDGA